MTDHSREGAFFFRGARQDHLRFGQSYLRVGAAQEPGAPRRARFRRSLVPRSRHLGTPDFAMLRASIACRSPMHPRTIGTGSPTAVAGIHPEMPLRNPTTEALKSVGLSIITE
jgi:hypothetical protein